MVNRVVADDELLEKGMKFAHRLGGRPDDRPRRDQADHPRPTGRAAWMRPTEVTPGRLRRSCSPPRTCKNAVDAFLEDGPGKATFEGR